MKDIVKSQVNDEYKVINGRKVKVSRRRRRSNLTTYCAIAVAGFSVLGLVISLFFLFDLKDVTISGVSLYTNDQILLVGGVEKGANLIRTNTSVIEQRLVDTLPYIEKATVTKDYPNSLAISVVEAEKCADIELNGRYFILSSSGIILEADNQYHDETLPLVRGMQLKDAEPNAQLASEDAGKTKVLMQILDSIKSTRFERITEIDLLDRTDIVLKYENRIELKVGSAIDMSYKLSYMKAVIDQYMPGDFEGTLIYNGANSGVSAISKEAQEANESNRSGSGVIRSSLTHDFGEPTEIVNGGSSQQQGESSASETPVQQQGAADEYTGWRE